MVRIRAKITRAEKFSFSHITPLETYQVLMGLNHRKSTSDPLPTRILKIATKVVCTPLTGCFNSALLDGSFPDEPELFQYRVATQILSPNSRRISIQILGEDFNTERGKLRSKTVNLSVED